MSDETKAIIFISIYEFIFFIDVLIDTVMMHVIFLMITLMFIVILYFDNKLDKEKRNHKKTKKRFNKQTRNYLETLDDFDITFKNQKYGGEKLNEKQAK